MIDLKPCTKCVEVFGKPVCVKDGCCIFEDSSPSLELQEFIACGMMLLKASDVAVTEKA